MFSTKLQLEQNRFKKSVFGRYIYRVSMITVANDIYMPWYCCHE